MHSSPRLETAREFAQGNEELSSFRQVLEDKMASGKIGQQLMEEAERRGGNTLPSWTCRFQGSLHVEGMNGRERLRKTLFELSFAGFGGDGPGGQFLWCSCPNGSWVVLTFKVCWQVPWRLSSSSGTGEFRCIRTCRSRVLREASAESTGNQYSTLRA